MTGMKTGHGRLPARDSSLHSEVFVKATRFLLRCLLLLSIECEVESVLRYQGIGLPSHLALDLQEVTRLVRRVVPWGDKEITTRFFIQKETKVYDTDQLSSTTAHDTKLHH